MEVEKYNRFVVNSSPKSQAKTKPKTKLEARGSSLENKKKSDIIYAKCFVKTSQR